MAQTAAQGPVTRPLLRAASVVVILAGLRAAAPVVLPLLVSLFLTLLTLPLLRWQVGRGVRPWLAVLVTVLGLLLVLSALGFLISGTINEFAQAAPGYLEQMVIKARSGLDALEARDLPVAEWFQLDRIEPQSLVNLLGGILGGTVRGVATAFSFATLVLLILVFMLSEAVGFPGKLAAALGSADRKPGYFGRIGEQIERYIEIKTAVSAATGVLLGLWALALGVPFPLLWGLLAFLLNYIPNIGSIIAAVPPVLLTLLQYGLGRALLVALGYGVVNLALGNLLEPRWMGARFGLSTLVVFLSLLFWGWLWGPLGMVLSVPLTVVIKIMTENTVKLRWVAILLGPNPPPAAVTEK